MDASVFRCVANAARAFVGGVLASFHTSDEANQTKLFDWVREQRPELRDAERAMTALEAVVAPGCGVLAAAVVGGGITFGLAYFHVSNLIVAIVGGLAGLLTLVPAGWGVLRLAQRPIVKQLVSSGTQMEAGPAGYRVAAQNSAEPS